MSKPEQPKLVMQSASRLLRSGRPGEHHEAVSGSGTHKAGFPSTLQGYDTHIVGSQAETVQAFDAQDVYPDMLLIDVDNASCDTLQVSS